MNKVLKIAIVVVVVLVIGGVAAFFLLGSSLKSNFTTAQPQFANMCSKLNAGDVSSAYAMTDKAFQEQFTLSQFDTLIATPLGKCKTFELADPIQGLAKYGDIEQDYFLGKITFVDGSNPIDGRITFIKRSGNWYFAGVTNSTTLDNL